MSITSNTFFQNTATGPSGAMWLDTLENVKVDNNIFDGNFVTAQGYNGPLDVTLSGATLDPNNDRYNLVGSSDAFMFNQQPDPQQRTDIIDAGNDPGLAPALGQNRAPTGYPPTLALQNNSPGFRKGDQNLAKLGTPYLVDARGFVRRSVQGQDPKVSIGAMDPDALPPQ